MRKILLITLSVIGLVTINSCKKDKQAPKPVSEFSFTGGGCTAPCAILFENKSTNATSYLWDFGDGTTSSESDPSKNYESGGTYTVILTATGEGGKSTSSKKVLIQQSTQSQLPTANFSFTGGDCIAPCEVNFVNTSSNANSYFWDFGDGNTSTLASPSHTYTKGGSYTVTLRASNTAGNDQISKNINITSPTTSLEITLKDEQESVISGASVKLYSSQSDWENQTNQIGETQYSDASGKVLFDNLTNIKYYWLAEKDCQNNYNSAITTTTALAKDKRNLVNISLQNTGTLKLTCTSSNPYRVYINGNVAFDMNGGTTRYLNNILTGSYTIRVLQLSGYVFYPTDETYSKTVSCGQTTSLSFP